MGEFGSACPHRLQLDTVQVARPPRSEGWGLGGGSFNLGIKNPRGHQPSHTLRFGSVGDGVIFISSLVLDVEERGGAYHHIPTVVGKTASMYCHS